jgi:hypothetical protein
VIVSRRAGADWQGFLKGALLIRVRFLECGGPASLLRGLDFKVRCFEIEGLNSGAGPPHSKELRCVLVVH